MPYAGGLESGIGTTRGQYECQIHSKLHITAAWVIPPRRSLSNSTKNKSTYRILISHWTKLHLSSAWHQNHEPSALEHGMFCWNLRIYLYSVDALNIQIMNILLCLCMIFIKFSVISQCFVGIWRDDTRYIYFRFSLIPYIKVKFILFQNNKLEVIFWYSFHLSNYITIYLFSCSYKKKKPPYPLSES